MQSVHALILASCALLLPLQAGCIIGFKVESSSATASDDDSQGSQSASSSTTAATSTSEGTSDGTGTASEGTTDATSDTTGDATSDTTTAATTSTSAATTETGGLGECEIDSECALASDCCQCAALPIGEDPDLCMAQCDTPRCEALGIAGAICRFGACMPARVPCDDSQLLCDALPPECPPGTLPTVDPQGTCYTGECAPAALCDRVPTCDACPADTMCVSTETLEGIPHTCEPIPAACEGTPSCACASNYACDAIYYQCAEQGNQITCSCPDC